MHNQHHGADLLASPSIAASRRPCAERYVAGFISLALVMMMLLPLLQNLMSQPRDCFPFSYYPMFSKRRSDVQTMRFVVVQNRNGKQRAVHYRYIGRGGMNQVRKSIRNTIKQGDAQSLCETVAHNIERRRPSRYAFATHVSVVTAKYRLSDYLQGETAPTSWQVEAEHPLSRRSSRGRNE